jgi:hypothetical protein
MNEVLLQQAEAVKDNLLLQETYRTVIETPCEFLSTFHVILNVLYILFIIMNSLHCLQQQSFVFIGNKKGGLLSTLLLTYCKQGPKLPPLPIMSRWKSRVLNLILNKK